MYRLVVLIGRHLETAGSDHTVAALAAFAAQHFPGKPARILDPRGNVVLRLIWPEVSQ